MAKDAMIGKKLTDIFPSVKGSSMERDLKRAFLGEFVYDLSFSSTVLSKTHFQNYYVPLFDDDRNVYAVMVIGHDISELHEATEKLRISNETLAEKNMELQRSNEDLEQFAYVASHDLQEPVRKIATYTDRLLTQRKENLSEDTKIYLERISKSTSRMYELINGLLLYSRVTRDGNSFTSTSLDGTLKQVLADFDLKIQQQKAVIRCQPLADLEAIPVQMIQLFTNLISNSLKFAKKDVPPIIQIAASDLTHEQKVFYNLNLTARYLNIFYLDNGIGFEQQFADKIFELFQRLHDRNTYPGSGIGLAICRKIVSNHHGMMYAFSEPDKGVTFQIILPYQQKPFAKNS
jgi:light-regulated signal transduction histidine kinase (bacteriophytochrome)